MRIQERGIGNMAFISVLILFVVATALAFVWRDEGETAKAQATAARADLRKADEATQQWQAAYNAMKATLGMSDPAIDGGQDNVPKPDDIQKYIRGELYKKAQECETKSAINLKSSVYQVDESKMTIVKQEGDTITVRPYSNGSSEETITVRQFLDYWPTPLENVKLIAEMANGTNAQTYQRLTEAESTHASAKQKAADDYAQDATLKQGVIDKQKGDLSSLRESVEAQTAKIDEAATAVEQTKQAAEKQSREYELTISALRNRLRNEQIKKEIALAEDPADGTVLLVSETRGTVWIDIGRKQRVSRGTKFKVWRAAKGNRREDIAVVEVFSVDDTKAECQITRSLSTTRVTKGMSISNPFFDPSRQMNAYIFGNLRTYPNDVARRRLAASGISVARYLDETVNIIILGEPPVTLSEVEDEEEAASIRRRQQLERSKRLDEIIEKARSINALVVTEETLSTFIEF